MIKKLIGLYGPFRLPFVSFHSFKNFKRSSNSVKSSQPKEKFQATINEHMENHIKTSSQAQQLTNSTISIDHNYYQSGHNIELLINTLGNMDLQTLQKKYLINFGNILVKKAHPKAKNIVQKINETLKKMNFQQKKQDLQVKLLINNYISGSCSNDKNISQTFKTLLEKKPQEKIDILTAEAYFTYLNSLPVPSQVDQQIRNLILKAIEGSISNLSIKNLVNFAISLNSLSHYDFLEEELEVVKKVFEKMSQQRSKFDQQTIEKIFAAKQYPSNKINLSQLHLLIIKEPLSFIQQQSPDIHRLFKLISIAYNKLRPSGEDIKEYPIQYFIVKYVFEHAFSRQKRLFSTLQAMVPTWLSDKSIPILVDILVENKVKVTPLLLYQLAKKGANIDELFKYAEIQRQNLSLRDSTLVLLALSNSSEFSKIKKQIKSKLRTQFQNFSIFYSYINQIKEVSDDLIKNICKVFRQQVNKLTEDAPNITKQNTMLSFLRFKIYSLDLTRQSINELQEYVKKIPPSIVQKFTQQWLKTNSPTNIGGVLYMLGTSKQLIKTKSAIQVMLRANKYWRENILKRTEQYEFQRILTELTNNSSYFIKSEEIKLDYIRLITVFVKYCNSDYNQCNVTEPYQALNYLSQSIRDFQQFPNIQILLCKKFIKHPSILYTLKDFLKQIDHEKYFTEFQIELIKVISDRSNIPQIDIINQKNLHVALEFPSLHYLFNLQKSEIVKIIQNSTLQKLELFLSLMWYYYNENNSIVYACIFRQYYSRINIYSDRIGILFKAIVNTKSFFSRPCQEIIGKYLKEITVSKRYKEEHFRITVLTLELISKMKLPSELTQNYIQNTLDNKKHEPLRIIKDIYQVCIFINYPFRQEDLMITQQFTPNRKFPYFFLLEQLFSREQRQKILQKIVQQITVQQSNKTNPKQMCVSIHQYYYLTKKYPEITKQLKLNLHSLPHEQLFSSLNDMIPRWTKIANFYKTPIVYFDLFGPTVLKVNDLIIINMQNRINAIYKYRFMERLCKIIYGQNTKITIVIKFPNKVKQIEHFFYPHTVFTKEQWTNFLEFESNLNSVQRKEAPKRRDTQGITSQKQI